MNAVVGVVVPVAADRRTPVGRNFTKFDIGWDGSADPIPLLHYHARHLLLDHVLLDTRPLFMERE